MLENIQLRWVVRDGEKVLQYRMREVPGPNAAYWESGRETEWIDVEESEE